MSDDPDELDERWYKLCLSDNYMGGKVQVRYPKVRLHRAKIHLTSILKNHVSSTAIITNESYTFATVVANLVKPLPLVTWIWIELNDEYN